jgi:hypothetical protein
VTFHAGARTHREELNRAPLEPILATTKTTFVAQVLAHEVAPTEGTMTNNLLVVYLQILGGGMPHIPS